MPFAFHRECPDIMNCRVCVRRSAKALCKVWLQRRRAPASNSIQLLLGWVTTGKHGDVKLLSINGKQVRSAKVSCDARLPG